MIKRLMRQLYFEKILVYQYHEEHQVSRLSFYLENEQ